MTHQGITIRMAGSYDSGAVRRLAALDGAAPLTGRVMLAETDRAPVAAVSLESGAVAADPFRHSAEAVRVLMLRRSQINDRGHEVAPARSSRRRRADVHSGRATRAGR
jgi:hypothetical protein